MHPYGRVLAIIPARHASSRFPGKPLVDLDGVPMIVRVARQVEAAERIGRVQVATDDRRILEACQTAGVDCVMTPSECSSGTDRVAAAYRTLGETYDHVINVQGDEPLIDPADIDVLAELCSRHPEAVTTLARPLEDDAESAHVVKVAAGEDGRALYFSRAPLAGALAHVGVYGFAPAVLERFTALPPSPLERAERLEQLRALENGIPIRVARCVSTAPSIGVDTPEDVAAVLRELKRRQTSPTLGTGIAHGS